MGFDVMGRDVKNAFNDILHCRCAIANEKSEKSAPKSTEVWKMLAEAKHQFTNVLNM